MNTYISKHLNIKLEGNNPNFRIFNMVTSHGNMYGKCPKISNTKVSDKRTYANSADPDQTVPETGV